MGDVSQSKCENSEIYARKRKTTKKKKKSATASILETKGVIS